MGTAMTRMAARIRWGCTVGFRHCLSVGLFGIALSSAPPAVAQSGTHGFAVDRYSPADPGSAWFVADSINQAGHGRLSFQAIGDWAHRPLVLNDDAGRSYAAVSDQIFLHLGAGVTLWDRATIVISAPIQLYSGADSDGGDLSSYGTASGGHLGDLRFGATSRLVGMANAKFRLGAGLHVDAPTGSRAAYGSDGKWRVAGRISAAGDIDDWAYAGALGLRYRALTDSYADVPLGSEATLVVAGGRHLARHRLLVSAELWASTVIENGDAIGKESSTPLELLLGGRFALSPAWAVGLAAGFGLFHGLGAPRERVLASVEWRQR
jgi:OmpA-OmpF porin, OOP family